MNATDTEILQTRQHRPYPLPHGPWIMHQAWLELLFAHWPISLEVLRPRLPQCLKLDTFEGTSWVSIVPFHMSNVRPRGFPAVPGLSAFPELNVRTYVVVNDIPGVYFFSLDAGNPVAVALARSLFHLPYFRAQMKTQTLDKTIHYESLRIHRGAPSASYRVRYRPIGPVVEATPGSLDAWLTERYSFYTTIGKALYRGDIHHVPWPLQAAELEIENDTIALSHDIHLPETPPLLHYSQRQDILAWPLRHVSDN